MQNFIEQMSLRWAMMDYLCGIETYTLQADIEKAYELLSDGSECEFETWQPFETQEPEAIAEMIETARDSYRDKINAVAIHIKNHLVDMAIDGSLPMDMNELDMTQILNRGWMK